MTAAQRRAEIRGIKIHRIRAEAAEMGLILIEPPVRYRCGECDTLLDEEERRCSDCNKFAARATDLVLVCPHCDEAVTEDDL